MSEALMMRRRALMQRKAGESPKEDWDIDWKYTDGPLENFGWQRRVQGLNTKVSMEPDGLHIASFELPSFVQYICPVSTCRKGIAEADLAVVEYTNYSLNGFRFLLSDGSKGCQFKIHRRDASAETQGLYYTAGERDQKIGPLPTPGTKHTVHIEFDSVHGNTVKFDGAELIISREISTRYVAGNKLFVQEFGEIALTGLRYKFIER